MDDLAQTETALDGFVDYSLKGALRLFEAIFGRRYHTIKLFFLYTDKMDHDNSFTEVMT